MPQTEADDAPTPATAAATAPGTANAAAAATTCGIDLEAVRTYRQARVRAEMVARGIDALIISDPVNIRYATDTRNMAVFTARNAPSRYCFLPAEGDVIMFEFTGAEHLSHGYSTVQQVRPARTASFVAAAESIGAVESAWAAEMAALVTETAGAGARIGIERMNAGAALALAGHGLELVDAQEPLERARAIKSAEEIRCVKASLRVTEAAMAKMAAAIEPGLTENELWSVFHQHVIANGADYIETRLMTAGTHTNPWFQETGAHVIEPNVLVAFDTDVVGVHGYYADLSRTFHVGPDAPTAEQRRLYGLAHEQVHHNMAIIEPGLGFAEYAARAWDLPDEFATNRYYLSAHGVGMTGEYPYLYHQRDFEAFGYDGVIEPGMTLCVESYVGAEGGAEGVKLEEQILVTESGIELLSNFGFEASLLP